MVAQESHIGCPRIDHGPCYDVDNKDPVLGVAKRFSNLGEFPGLPSGISDRHSGQEKRQHTATVFVPVWF